MTGSSDVSYVDMDGKSHPAQVEGAESSESPPSRAQAKTRPRAMEFSPLVPDPQEPSRPAPLYTAEDLARAVEEARRSASLETETALRAAMAKDIEQRRSDMLAEIRDQLDQQKSVSDEERARWAVVSQKLSLAMVKAIIPRALEKNDFADITDLLKGTLTRLAAEPAIELRLSPHLMAFGQAALADLAVELGFAGEVMAVADPSLAEGDAELRWKGGAISHRLDRLQAEAFDLVDHWLSAQPMAASEDVVPSSSSIADSAPGDERGEQIKAPNVDVERVMP